MGDIHRESRIFGFLAPILLCLFIWLNVGACARSNGSRTSGESTSDDGPAQGNGIDSNKSADGSSVCVPPQQINGSNLNLTNPDECRPIDQSEGLPGFLTENFVVTTSKSAGSITVTGAAGTVVAEVSGQSPTAVNVNFILGPKTDLDKGLQSKEPLSIPGGKVLALLRAKADGSFSATIPLPATFEPDDVVFIRVGGSVLNGTVTFEKSNKRVTKLAYLILNGDSVFQPAQAKGQTGDTGTMHGNFMLVDERPDFKASQEQYANATAPFAQIWKDTITGLYVTNILNDSHIFTFWEELQTLCQNVKTMDGTGGWVLPSKDQLQSLANHGLGTSVPKYLDFRTWVDIQSFWSSTLLDANSAWFVNVLNLQANSIDWHGRSMGGICVRN